MTAYLEVPVRYFRFFRLFGKLATEAQKCVTSMVIKVTKEEESAFHHFRFLAEQYYRRLSGLVLAIPLVFWINIDSKYTILAILPSIVYIIDD